MILSTLSLGKSTNTLLKASQFVRGYASTKTDGSVKFKITTPYKTHKLDKAPSEEVYATKDELMKYYRLMYTMRRMEITCDNEYKARNIRGFCHLYDGQEAIATGLTAALTFNDCWITSYRCHCIMLARGGTVKGILGELFGRQCGHTKGKGGSMHFYNKKNNFYGGQGIVGSQVPVGTGLAFAQKYNHDGKGPMPMAIACYGDGAANQGQIWEAANIASLWKLPMVFCTENNQYGMGTSSSRSSSNNKYYTMGNHIPGLWCDGMDVLAVKEAGRFIKEWTGNGNGPIFLEMSTYRYHGHSMSDPGISYRNRDEITKTRAARDPIESVRKRLLDAKLATIDELKEIEKEVRKEVSDATSEALKSPWTDVSETYTDVYADANGKNEYPSFIRLPDYTKSLVNGKPM